MDEVDWLILGLTAVLAVLVFVLLWQLEAEKTAQCVYDLSSRVDWPEELVREVCK